MATNNVLETIKKAIIEQMIGSVDFKALLESNSEISDLYDEDAFDFADFKNEVKKITEAIYGLC